MRYYTKAFKNVEEALEKSAKKRTIFNFSNVEFELKEVFTNETEVKLKHLTPFCCSEIAEFYSGNLKTIRKYLKELTKDDLSKIKIFADEEDKVLYNKYSRLQNVFLKYTNSYFNKINKSIEKDLNSEHIKFLKNLIKKEIMASLNNSNTSPIYMKWLKGQDKFNFEGLFPFGYYFPPMKAK